MKILVYFIIIASILVAIFQYLNWKKYQHEGNGANLQRVSLAIISMATLGICIGYILKDFNFIAIWLLTIPAAMIALYWVAIKQMLLVYYNIIKNKIK